MKVVLSLLIVCFSFLGFSQSDKKENALFTIRGNIGIPRVIGSQMFRTTFAGLYEANLSANVKLFDNFFIGVGYQNTQFQNNKFLKFQYFNASIPYNTRLLSSGIFLKLGYDKFFSDKNYASFSLNSGLMLNEYFNVNADTSKSNKPFGLLNFTAPYVQPEVSLNFTVEKHLSFSILLSYTTMFYKYDPKAPRFNQFQEVKDSRNRYFMNWINIGFGFNILLNKKTKE
ncbi:MAG: hypothetical protein Q7W45_03095 [Bacteroidota bacterium]|nr:hypothetical protein [Bacteroidota bacterium]MDP3145759.1 hypothetical protein [Bacteroidota bacterium]